MDQQEVENKCFTVRSREKFKGPYFDNLITSSWDMTLSFTD